MAPRRVHHPDVFDVLIGGTASGSGNTIALNWSAARRAVIRGGEAFPSQRQERHSRQLYFRRRRPGIDLGDDGVTPNDSGDGDTGPNDLQNFPVLTSALISGNTTTLDGTLNSTPNSTFGIEFYSNAALDPTTFGEGQTFLGSLTVTTDASGNVTFSFVGNAVTGQVHHRDGDGLG